MRPQQQNRRMRGRNNNNSGGNNNSNNNNNNNNNNRRGPNALTRSYESNGPDVKIRGSAQQIAEKYTTLARDAMSSGDRVVAENYLQHAEHYNRIIAAAQAQMPVQAPPPPRNDLDDEMDEDGDDFGSFQNNGNGAQPHINVEQPPQPQPQIVADSGAGPQPIIEGMPAEVALNPEAASVENKSAGAGQPRVNGNEQEQPAAEGEEAGVRRPRRPRRSRTRTTSNAEDADNQAAQADAPQQGAPDTPSLEPVDN